MEIIFIRHPEKNETENNPYLTEKGVKQATYLANRLKNTKFNEFYCSDMNRTKQTAKIVSEQIKIKPKIEKSLNEFTSSVLLKNKSKLTKNEKKHFNDLTIFLEKISKKMKSEKAILIIAHGITNRIILSHFLDINLKNLIRFRQSECGMNSIYWVEKFKNWRLKSWNDNNHIPLKIQYNKLSY